jgi:hypothetical protein
MSFIKQVLPIAASIAAGVATGGSSTALQAAMAGAAASAGTTGLMGGDTNEMLMSGAGGAAGGMGGSAARGALNATQAAAPVSEGLGQTVVNGQLMAPTNNLAMFNQANAVPGQIGAGGLPNSASFMPMTQQPAQKGLGEVAMTSGKDAGIQEMMANQTMQQAGQNQALNQGASVGLEQGAVDPAATGGLDSWVANNQGKSLLGLGAAAMGTDAYYRDKAEDEAKDRRKKDKKDWRGRVDWYNSQSGPTNEMTDYENR